MNHSYKTILIIIFLTIIAGVGLFGLQYQYQPETVEAQQEVPPRIFYTDIISGPNTGGKDNNGCFLTISGKRFGASRGSSRVTVGGGEVIDYITWFDTKIEVQLGTNAQTGSVVVSTANGQGVGPEQFTVRDGTIYFMSLSGSDSASGDFNNPWQTFSQSKTKLAPGDFLYVRGGDYIVGPSVRHLRLYSGEGGEPGRPVTYSAYPSERAYLGTTDAGHHMRGINFERTDIGHFVFAGFYIEGTLPFTIRGIDVRTVNNTVWHANYYGAIQYTDAPIDDAVILGNTIYDSCYTNKQYHAIYISYPNTRNVLIAHNTVYDIYAGRGVQVYHGDAQNQFYNVIVRDNLFYDIGRDGILISGYTVDAKVYNNIVINTGYVDYGGIRVNTRSVPSTVEVYNNTIYGAGSGGYGGFVIGNHDELYLRNNIVISTGRPYAYVGEGGTEEGIFASNNLYYGAGAPPSFDSGSLNIDPLFVDLANRDFHLQSDSPAIDVGYNTAIGHDYDGITRPQETAYDIGAYEYTSGVVGPSPPDTTPPGNITNFQALAGDAQIVLSWSNPTDSDYQGTKVIRKQGSYPTSITDGTQVYDGIGTGYTDTNLINGTTYYYTGFSYDEVPNYSQSVSSAQDSATPQASSIGTFAEEWGDASNTDYPGTIEDTYIDQGTAGTNHSQETILWTYTYPANTIANSTMLKWDLLAIPQTAAILNAQLQLYSVASPEGSFGDASYDVSVHKIINVNPVISQTTWNQYRAGNNWPGGVGGLGDIAQAEDTQTLNTSTNVYRTWNVINMVADWVANPNTNYGMLINSDSIASQDSHRTFASTQDTNPSHRPKLIITYSTGAGTPEITLTKQVDKSEAASGDELTYTITYQNTGTGEARNIVISDVVPNGTVYVSGGDRVESGVVYWDIDSVLPDAGGSVELIVQVE